MLLMFVGRRGIPRVGGRLPYVHHPMYPHHVHPVYHPVYTLGTPCCLVHPAHVHRVHLAGLVHDDDALGSRVKKALGGSLRER